MSDIFMVNFALSWTFPSWTLVVPLCMVAWTAAEGKVQVIGSLQPIIAAPGDDAILPCHLEPYFNVEGLTVEWSKPDLKPDPSDRLSRVEYVHLYRNQHTDPDMQLPSYFSRTSLFTDGLKRGNISLRIMNVTLEDGGRYRCFIPKLKSEVKDSIVVLVVDPNFIKTTTTETPLHPSIPATPDPNEDTNVEGGRSSRHRLISLVVFLVFVLILVVGVGARNLLKHKCSKKDLSQLVFASNKPLPV